MVERLIAQPRRSPMVMLDAEDALALTEDAAARGREGAVNVLSGADWSGGGPQTSENL